MDRDQEVDDLRAQNEELKELLAQHERLDEERWGYMERLLAEREAQAAELRATFHAMSEGVIVVRGDGTVRACNPASERIIGPITAGKTFNENLGLFDADNKAPLGSGDHPMERALRGHRVESMDAIARGSKAPEGVWIHLSTGPITNDEGDVSGAVIVFHDADNRMRWERERTERLEQLQEDVKELSAPILEVWDDVLALPVIGSVDGRRSTDMMERLLDAVVEKQSRFVLLDITGVDHMDTFTADRILKLVQAVELLGSRCVLTGTRASVAQTLMSLGVQIGPLTTLRTLKHGLKECLRLRASDAERELAAPPASRRP